MSDEFHGFGLSYEEVCERLSTHITHVGHPGKTNRMSLRILEKSRYLRRLIKRLGGCDIYRIKVFPTPLKQGRSMYHDIHASYGFFNDVWIADIAIDGVDPGAV